jgi:low temperature requirement protein LtrA
MLWWSWVGYAWLTSVVDPEEGTVRLVMFVAMAAFLVAALAVPEAFEGLALLFAVAYTVVRVAHIGLFVLASRDDPDLRKAIIGFSVSTVIGTTLLLVASATDGALQGSLWAAALVLDASGPYFSGADGWKIVPQHFAERHGLIVIIALGESIVAIGVGAEHGIDTGVVVAAILGMAAAAALWWMYFDVVALVAARRLANAPAGREQNEIARDSFSYIHFPMIAGIVLFAFGLKTTLAGVGDHLKIVPACALLGGVALYLLAHVAFRYRNVRRISTQRIAGAVLLAAFVPAARQLPALVTLAVITVVMIVLVEYERRYYAELRDRLRHQLTTG